MGLSEIWYIEFIERLFRCSLLRTREFFGHGWKASLRAAKPNANEEHKGMVLEQFANKKAVMHPTSFCRVYSRTGRAAWEPRCAGSRVLVLRF